MEYPKEQRIELERCIIGAVMLENRYDQVGNILRPSNFTKLKTIDYQLIWREIALLAESEKHYGPKSMSHHLMKMHKVNYSYELAVCTSLIISTQTLSHMAMELLEVDIRSKLSQQIGKWMSENNEIKYRALLQEILTHIENTKEDVFEVIDSAEHFLTAFGYEKESQFIKAYNVKLDLRARMIKSEWPILKMLDRLERAASLEVTIPESARHQLKLLSSGITHVLTSNQLPKNIINQLNDSAGA